MKRLIIMRHAKSSWDDPAQADPDRPLNSRGRGAAPTMARFLLRNDFMPDLTLCSSAVRATQTYALVAAEDPRFPEPLVEDGLYLCGAGALFHRVCQLPATAQTAMLVSHNPDCHQLCLTLAAEGDRPAMRRLATDFPTGATAVIGLEIAAWDRLEPGSGSLAAFGIPRDES